MATHPQHAALARRDRATLWIGEPQLVARHSLAAGTGLLLRRRVGEIDVQHFRRTKTLDDS